MGSKETPELDALVVGAGFSGLYTLHKLRSEGLSVILHESGGDMGGVWYWNCYPGARVDTEFFIYQLSNPEIYKDFEFKERFPPRDEILRYFHHVDKVLDLSKDIRFNTKVTKAEWNEERHLWKIISTRDGNVVVNHARHLILCTGFASKRYTPDIKGLEKFKGQICHSSLWPQDKKVEYEGKNVAVVGTGASGVQVIQGVAPYVSHLTVYQRTPNFAIPMAQLPVPHPLIPSKPEFPSIFSKARGTFGGMPGGAEPTNAVDVTPERRREVYESLWAHGALSFWLYNFQDLFYSQESNDFAYAFWAEKTRERIQNERKRDILAPLTPPHGFGLKRPSAEENYYEIFNQPNVDLIDVSQSPILEVTENGIITKEEGEVEADVIIFATGFDSVTGGILNIDISNGKGLTIQEKWREGTKTQLGMTTSGFPNLYFMYGPQAPTAFLNGAVNAARFKGIGFPT